MLLKGLEPFCDPMRAPWELRTCFLHVNARPGEQPALSCKRSLWNRQPLKECYAKRAPSGFLASAGLEGFLRDSSMW